MTRALATPEPQAVAEHHRIVACDGKSAARGVRPGLATAAATALARELAVHPRNRNEETECLLGLAGWAVQFTPSVALELHPPESAGLALEVSGSLQLFGGLRRIAASLREGCARMGYTAVVAAAPTARGASWLARSGSEILVEDSDALECALAGLPVRVMAGDAETVEALAAIGATHVADVLALPRAGLARRFGRNLLDDLDRALGRMADPRTFFTPPATFSARLELPAEVTQTEALLFAAKRLFVQLEGFLAARAAGVQRLALRLFHREARFTEVPIGLVAPARDATHFTLLAASGSGGSLFPRRCVRSRSSPATWSRLPARRSHSSTTALRRPATGESSSSGCAPGSVERRCTALQRLRSTGRSVRQERARSAPAQPIRARSPCDRSGCCLRRSRSRRSAPRLTAADP